MFQKVLVSILENFVIRCNFTNKVGVCRETLSRRRSALPDSKEDPESDPESEPKLP
jgi:hypothetical protein